MSSLGSTAGTPDEGFLGVDGFLEWMGLAPAPRDRLGLGERFLFAVVGQIKAFPLLKKRFFDRLNELGELLRESEAFLGLRFADFERDFRQKGSCEALHRGCLTQKSRRGSKSSLPRGPWKARPPSEPRARPKRPSPPPTRRSRKPRSSDWRSR